MNSVQASGFFNEPGSLKKPEACTLFIFRRYPPFVKFGCPEEPPVLCQGNRGTAPEKKLSLDIPYVQETFTLRALKLKPLENKLRLRNSTPILRRRIQFYAEV